MTIEEAVFERVTEQLSTIIGDRCYPLNIPQDVPLPAIAYQVISSVPQFSHDGFSNLTVTRVQFTCVGDDYAQAKDTDIALRAAFNAVQFVASDGLLVQLARIDNETDDFDTTDFEPLVRTDVLLWHSETIVTT